LLVLIYVRQSLQGALCHCQVLLLMRIDPISWRAENATNDNKHVWCLVRVAVVEKATSARSGIIQETAG